jgi:acyl-CoA reductase-like NAD-dependent aldehyde dehydrogenase
MHETGHAVVVRDAVATLARGSAAWVERSPADRSLLACATARATAAAADAWVAAAVGIKAGGLGPRAAVPPAIVAEETATGPLATLRLLLITARAFADVAQSGRPRLPRAAVSPRSDAGPARRIEVDLLPASGPGGSLHDSATFAGHRATTRCGVAGDLADFAAACREEAARRPRTGGVAVVLGAGNVTGLAAGDCISQIFEHGRGVLLKLHPLHAPLAPVLAAALAPLVEAHLLVIVCGGAEVAREAVACPRLDHVHLTGSAAAFESLVWGGPRREGATPLLSQSITCELGNISPWIVVPGRYTSRQLAAQADMVAASIINNTSFNCIATKLVVTAGAWEQREAWLELVRRRLASVPARPAWVPGATATWAEIAAESPPPDGTLPWVFRTGIDPDRDPQFTAREWFVPVVAEMPLAAGSIAAFCTAVESLLARLPGSLAASVTLPPQTPAPDRARLERLIDGLPFGVVAVNTWSALAYSFGCVPWGGYPGGTLAEPRSGIGHVHDPLLLPAVHTTIVRGPLASRMTPAWFPWHRHAARLARGMIDVYGANARGGRGLGPLLRMLPEVLTG